VDIDRWLPEIIRARPRTTFRFDYDIIGIAVAPPSPEAVARAAESAHVSAVRKDPVSWELRLRWTTRVFGIIGRDVEESADLQFLGEPDGGRLRLTCLPVATHEAHAAGMGGVIVMTAAVWLAGGWLAGVPAAVATLAAGSLWALYTREMALQVLERRLRRLIEDLGTAVWPGLPAQLLPPPRKLV